MCVFIKRISSSYAQTQNTLNVLSKTFSKKHSGFSPESETFLYFKPFNFFDLIKRFFFFCEFELDCHSSSVFNFCCLCEAFSFVAGLRTFSDWKTFVILLHSGVWKVTIYVVQRQFRNESSKFQAKHISFAFKVDGIFFCFPSPSTYWKCTRNLLKSHF